jgi:hypothetical protein
MNLQHKNNFKNNILIMENNETDKWKREKYHTLIVIPIWSYDH